MCGQARRNSAGFAAASEMWGFITLRVEEDEGEPENLMWACKSCNSTIAVIMKRHGIGRRVEQYNPRRVAGLSKRTQMDGYGNAIKVMRGEFEGNISHAMQTIRATPSSMRSAYTRRTWPTRKQIYGPSGRQSPFPPKAETIRPLSSPGLVPRGIYIPIIFGDDTRMRFLDLSDTISEVQK